MDNVKKCPNCGNSDFIEGVQGGYAAVSPASKTLILKSQALYHVICVNCGTVVKTYVKKSKKINDKKRTKRLKIFILLTKLIIFSKIIKCN